MLHACFYTICLVFLLFLCFRRVIQKYSQNWTKQKPNIQKFIEASREPKRRWKGARRRPHHQGARPRSWPRHPMVRAPWSTSDDAPSPIKTPRWKKPKHPITFPEIYHDPSPSSTRDREGQKLFLTPCRRGESPPDVFFIAILASGAMSE
jgi:hypothetical protein